MFDKLEGHVLDWLAQLPSDVNKIKGWYDATLEADHWSVLQDIKPVDAAMLLCQFNPNDTNFDDVVNTTNDQTGPRELIQLRQRFEELSKSEPKQRTLRNWHQAARAMGVRYHLWIDDYIEAAPGTESAQNAASAAPPDSKPWLIADPKDPIASQPWYTTARYFSRQLVLSDSTLLIKKLLLADKVSKSLTNASIYKHGGRKPHAAETVLKAFLNVNLV